ncbi:hypothetical protein [Ferrimonas sediminicola]|uniref:hypothetical protein n=1 Tax=Ferrimonas sediminicola TaxID=2569538 RepID=UPI00145D6AA8|nr:hypothetical protein [Ferrimonas sediminicola]
MMGQQRQRVEQVLTQTRRGDCPRSQALAREWGQEMDAGFSAWLVSWPNWRRGELVAGV